MMVSAGWMGFRISVVKSCFSVLERLVSRLTDIRELDLSDCTLLSTDAILCLARLRYLEYISLSRCYKLASYQAYM